MANVTIAGGSVNLPVASTIDGSADYTPIYTASALATQAINRNTYLGLASAPLGLTDSQAPTNKTLGNTNTITVKAANLTIQDGSDTTKQAKFVASGITTGNTRSFTLPDLSDTVVTLTATQTLTNKTLTSPTITAPTITNATISADTVTGFSSSTTGTIYGISIASGVLGAGTVVPNSLLASTGSSWVWQSFTPSWTNLTVGNGTNTGFYAQIGKTVIVRFRLIFGSTTSISGAPTITVPVTMNSYYSTASTNEVVGSIYFIRPSSNVYVGQIYTIASNSVVSMAAVNVAGTYASQTLVSSTVPITWQALDEISAIYIYEAA